MIYYNKHNRDMSILSAFSKEEIEQVINDNPSLRGFLQGYLAEVALKKLILEIPGVTSVTKIPDQADQKGDFMVKYHGVDISIESKSIGTNSVKEDVLNDTWQGTVHIKNTDKRDVEIEGVGVIRTSSLCKGQFDILAVSCYAVSGTWDFVYMENEYLPAKSPDMPKLLKTSFVVNPETTPLLTDSLVKVLDSVLEKKLSTSR